MNADNKNFDIGIIGVWYGLNYGSVFTYYALQYILKEFGLVSLMIEKPGIRKGDFEIRDSHARRFANEHFYISDIRPLDRQNELNKLCDGFIVGSDQVWNYGISKNFGKSFYLDFAEDKKKKIAYAASFGHNVDFAPPEERKVISFLMQRFNAISVREDDGVRLCRDIYHVDATHVLDPVFLVKSEHYMNFVERSKFHEHGSYMLVYILDATPEKRQLMLHMSQKLGLRPVIILDGFPSNANVSRKIFDMDDCVRTGFEVYDWLYLFKNASYVLTDSYHGVCFSILFGKQFLPLPNKKRGYSRFTSIANLMGFSERLITEPIEELKNEIFMKLVNYEYINGVLSIERKRCRKWLRDALEGLGGINLSATIPSKQSYNIFYALDIEHDCTGCGSCISCCPTGALELKSDRYGYYRCSLNDERCIKCKKCISVCPAFELPEKKNSKNPILYMFQAADKELLYNSTSGAIFPLLAKQIIAQKGCVVGVAWTDDFRCKHILVENMEDVSKLSKSKYLQSYTGNIGRHVKERLDKGQKVLFSGCPCQVAGLLKLIGDNDNLLTVDILCAYAPSSLFFKKYIDEDFGDRLRQYTFRHKAQGWDCSYICANVDGVGDIFRKGAKEDAYQCVFHDHTMISKHCENCNFQTIPRFGDLTIGDFWGISRREPSLNSKLGISAILCNNNKGKNFLESIPKDEIAIKEEKPLDWLGANGLAVKGHNYKSQYRDRFYKYILNNSFSDTLQLMKNADDKNQLDSKMSILNYVEKSIKNWCNYKKSIYRYKLYVFQQMKKFGKVISASIDRINIIKSFSRIENEIEKFNRNINSIYNRNNVLNCEFKPRHFLYENEYWEEKILPDRLLLHAKLPKSPRRHFASLYFEKPLTVGRTYRIIIRFRADTASKAINFLVTDIKNPEILQKVKSYPVNIENRGKWIEISEVFVCEKGNINSFSVGAALFTGKNRYIEFEYIKILEG